MIRKLTYLLLLPAWLLTLSACSTLENILPWDQRPLPPIKDKPVQSSKKTGGGYYLDDGPGDNPPANILAIPDAEPRLEPYANRANKPYIALGVTYTPMTEFQPYKQQGIASWYGRRYHGQKTSIGEIYDMYAMTGAHTTLPLPSYVKVTNPENGNSVIVRINDRGPFHEGRLIDLSYAAAYKLGVAQKGSGMVQVEAIDIKQYLAEKNGTKAPSKIAEKAPAPAPVSAPATSNAANDIVSGIYIQLGAFRQAENASLLSQKLREQQLMPAEIKISNWLNQDLYRVIAGPFDSRASAEQIAEKIKVNLKVSTIVVNF
jgi:rare lipoprotein A